MDFPINNLLLKSILEDTPTFMGIYDITTHRYAFINKVGLNMFEATDIEEFTLKYPEGFRKDKLNLENYNEIYHQLKTKQTRIEETLFETSSKLQFWGTLQISLFESEGHEYYLVRINDTTYQKNAEQQLEDDNNRFEALFMHAAIGLIMVDREGKIILSNRFANVIFGYETGELEGQLLEVLIPHNIREKHRETYENYTHKPQSRPMGIGLDLKARKKDGTLFPVEISLSHFKSGGKPYYISFINDATFKKKAETDLLIKTTEIQKLNNSLEKEVVNRTNALVETLKNLEQSKKELEVALNKEKELGELKSRFVSMASHEFRTPLTAILSAASLIEKYVKTEEQDKRERHTQRIMNAVGNLTDILEEFLSVGKLEEGKVNAKLANFELPALVDESLRDLKNMLKKNQQIDYQHIGDTTVCLDKSLFRKIIINLGSNAVKFSNENSTISISTEKLEKMLILKVSDQGIGISEEDQKHLFDRFFRGANVTNIQGTGLGLHIVARYTELLGGQVFVESKLNRGTTFSIKFDL
ncbi:MULTISPECIES: ATP-binding protein [unclassified Arcicella]|uniref:sensor histidine kinase n=1 Tax=unclassified Arcicella TaxID=2644986 RepID=UPI002862C35D|nr:MULTISPECIES: ATP-binding protein [unclassified Arcicella]MDR6560749.1 PAS domain S-box-containing protein [Arcicella sp. BE51]MDR6810633.1 PAS domain S-box-containing protein [Arcicella sp. BE140]MDR6821983.1 PAS domain S-box-containing protein [Arcicella sp. BE139]